MKKLGQHFLKNTAALERIVAAVAPARGDHIIEIGPGHGELTLPLLGAVQKFEPVPGATIISIEKDHALVADLLALAEKEVPGRLSIIEGDALTLLPGVVRKLAADADTGANGSASDLSYKIVGNIPYYITGKLLRVISELERKPELVVLMIQKEVAERICAVPPEMNRLAASVQFWADATIAAIVPRKDFSPAPEVDSAVIVLGLKKTAARQAVPKKGAATTDAVDADDAEQYYKAVRGIFAQPRKTLLNNIMAMGEGQSDVQGASKKEIIAARLKECGVDPGARPQDLGIPQIMAIARADLWG